MMSPIGLGWFFQTWGRRARNAFGYLDLHWTHLRTHGYQLLCFFSKSCREACGGLVDSSSLVYTRIPGFLEKN